MIRMATERTASVIRKKIIFLYKEKSGLKYASTLIADILPLLRIALKGGNVIKSVKKKVGFDSWGFCFFFSG